MGIYNRDYMHDEPRGGGFSIGSFRSQAVTVQLIVVNVAVFVLWLLAGRGGQLLEFMGAHFTVSADGVIQHFRVHTLITSAFSQFAPMHILFNMLFLYMFGKDVEGIYGRKDFLCLYLVAGAVAAAAHCTLTFFQGIPNQPALGASGSIMGIVVVYACFYPNRLVYFMGFFPITVRWLAILYIALDVFGVLHGGGNVANAAHLGGAATGYLFYKLDLRLFSRRSPRGPKTSFHLRDHHERLESPAAARVDALLEKIAREGKDSLTEDEKEFLREASRRYRS